MELQTVLQGMVDALSAETAEVARTGGHSFPVNDGRCVTRGNPSVYSFETDAAAPMPDDVRTELVVGHAKYEGVLLSSRGTSIVVELQASSSVVGEAVRTGVLRTHLEFLLEALRDRVQVVLKGTHARDAAVARALFAGIATAPPGAAAVVTSGGKPGSLNKRQREAVCRLSSQHVTFVWGPPGTGKTRALGAAVLRLMDQGERIVVSAHSNAALDVAMSAIIGAVGQGRAAKKVLRYGPVTPEWRDRLEPITLVGKLRRGHPERYQELLEADAEVERLVRKMRGPGGNPEDAERLKQVQGWHGQFMEALRDWERKLAGSCQVVGCTLSKAAIDAALYGQRFDAAIIDEASMALPPSVVLMASLSGQRIGVFGDPRQLAPICSSDEAAARKWLAEDIFHHCGVTDPSGSNPRRVMLRTQYRMHPVISRVVSEFAYGGLLRDAAGLADRLQSVTGAPPGEGDPLLLYETAPLDCCCHSEAAESSWSRFNPRSAAVAAAFALQVVGATKHGVGIITPYAAQARLLRAMLRDLRIGDNVRASTVHRFQGSEEDVVILDLCEGQHGQEEPSKLLRDSDVALRLLNVGLSRARGKAIVLAARSWLMLSKAHELKNFLKLLNHAGHAQALDPLALSDERGAPLWLLPAGMEAALPRIRKDLRAATGRPVCFAAKSVERVLRAGDVVWLLRDPSGDSGVPWVRLRGPKTAAALSALYAMPQEGSLPEWLLEMVGPPPARREET